MTHIIAINPNDGDDATLEPNSDWAEVIDLFSGVPNVKLIGYVNTNFGDEGEEDEVKEELNGYHDNGWKVEG